MMHELQDRMVAGAEIVPSPFANLAFLEPDLFAGFWRWRVRSCVFCGGEHLHGAGDLAADPRLALGHRSAFCCRSGYWLCDPLPRLTLKTIRRAHEFLSSRPPAKTRYEFAGACNA
jgi:hypothetical protein